MTRLRITRRGMTKDDQAFSNEVYASTREDVAAIIDWSPEQKTAFIRSQFEAQCSYYEQEYRSASYEVLLIDGQPAGRLFVNRADDEIHVIDIALLPTFRGQGIGSSILAEILTEARHEKLPVTIYVERVNRAFGLYQRLGFVTIKKDDIYLLMSLSPPPVAGVE